MPIYEFVCEACGRLVESLQKLTDPPPDACPECGGKMAKIMSRNSFQLKGGGWYKDLYSSAAGTVTPETKAADKPAAAAADKPPSAGEKAPGAGEKAPSSGNKPAEKAAEKPAAAAAPKTETKAT